MVWIKCTKCELFLHHRGTTVIKRSNFQTAIVLCDNCKAEYEKEIES